MWECFSRGCCWVNASLAMRSLGALDGRRERLANWHLITPPANTAETPNKLPRAWRPGDTWCAPGRASGQRNRGPSEKRNRRPFRLGLVGAGNLVKQGSTARRWLKLGAVQAVLGLRRTGFDTRSLFSRIKLPPDRTTTQGYAFNRSNRRRTILLSSQIESTHLRRSSIVRDCHRYTPEPTEVELDK